MDHLNQLLRPKSVAVIGASVRSFRAGNIVMKNLLQGGFDGAIMPVTPYYPAVCGVLAYKTISDLRLCLILRFFVLTPRAMSAYLNS